MYLVTVNWDKCRGCGECVKVCPSKAFLLVEEDGRQVAQYVLDTSDCISCYSCEVTCEDGAIQVLDL